MDLLDLILNPVLLLSHCTSLFLEKLPQLFIEVRQALGLLRVLFYFSVFAHAVFSDFR